MQSIDILNRNPSLIQKAIDGDIVLFSLDVVSMYPNIAHKLALKVCAFMLDKFGENNYPKPSNECLIDLIGFHLRSHVAQFNGNKFDSGDTGIGQGFDFGAQLCDLTMLLFDILLKDTKSRHHNVNRVHFRGEWVTERECVNGWLESVTDLKIHFVERYRDDYLFIAEGTIFDVNMLVAALNNITSYSPLAIEIFNEYGFGLDVGDRVHIDNGEDRVNLNRIQFTRDIDPINPISIKVLDVTVGWDHDTAQLVTKTTAKPTDTHCYVPPTSMHHPSVFTKGTPKTVALRIRSTTDDKFIDDTMHKYKCYLIARGFDPMIIHRTFYEMRCLTKMQAVNRWKGCGRGRGNWRLQPQQSLNDVTHKIKLVVKYHSLLPNFWSILKSSWNKWIKPHPVMSMIFPLEIFQPVFMRYKTIRELLAPNKYRNDETNPFAAVNSLPWCWKAKLTETCSDADLLRLSEKRQLFIDGKEVDSDRLTEWKGFMKCSDLSAAGIIKKSSPNCKCNTSEIYVNTKSFTDDVTGQKISCAQSSCFTKNSIYIIQCKSCKKNYAGKAGEGINDDRTLRRRTSEHIGKIKKVYEELESMDFYDSSGTMTDNIHRKWAAAKKEFGKDSNYTSEVIHFVGLDGSDCYKKVAEPIDNYQTFIVDIAHGLTQSIKESKLCIQERRRQGQLSTIRHGMNDTRDFHRSSRFTADYGHRVVQSKIDSERDQIDKYHRNSNRLLELLRLSDDERAGILRNDPLCPIPMQLVVDKLVDSVGRNRNGYTIKELQAECRRHSLPQSGRRKVDIRDRLISHYNNAHSADIECDE